MKTVKGGPSGIDVATSHLVSGVLAGSSSELSWGARRVDVFAWRDCDPDKLRRISEDILKTVLDASKTYRTVVKRVQLMLRQSP